MALAVLNLASQARFSPGQVVMTIRRRRETGPTGPAQPTPYLRRHLHGDWGDLSDDDRRQNDAALEVRRGSSVLVLPGHADLKLWIITRMGSQRHHAAAAQRILIPSDGLAPFLSSHPGHVIAPWEVHAPLPWSITMSLDLETIPETAVQGDLLEAAASPSRSACRTSCPNSATSCSILSTAPILRSHPDRCGRIGRSSSPASSASCSRRKPMWSMPSPGCWSTAANAPRSSMARWDAARRPSASPRPPCSTPKATAAPWCSRHPTWSYKWRREIQETVAGAKVWVLNGPDTLVKLLKLREQLGVPAQGQGVLRPGPRADADGVPLEARLHRHRTPTATWRRARTAAMSSPTSTASRSTRSSWKPRSPAASAATAAPLWTLIVRGPVRQRPVLDRAQSAEAHSTIGEVTAQKLMQKFGDAFLASMLGDNIHEFINLMDGNGELVFSGPASPPDGTRDGQHGVRLRRGRLPAVRVHQTASPGTFDLLIADEAHEYKNGGSAQGQAMGCWRPRRARRLLLTGTLMGGYGDDLFHLLFRALPGRMIEDGYRPTKNGSMTSAAMAFMRDHGVLKDIYSESTGTAHKTAKGTKVSVRTVKAPGFGPKGVLRCVLPFTVFLKLKDIGGNVLPPYDEEFREVAMDTAQAAAYRDLAGRLTQELKQALAKRDTTLLGVVLNVLLAWPDCCFRSETVVHPRTRNTLAFVPAQFNELEVMPKERELIEICQAGEGRRSQDPGLFGLTGTRDTTSRLKVLLEQEGFKVAVLRASVDASRREDWIAEQLGPRHRRAHHQSRAGETGLDLLEFPTIVFLQSGYNVYSLQQAARRSWRIGQKQPVRVIYLGYAKLLADDLPGVDGQEDHGVAEHVGRRARIRARCPEPGRRLGGGGTGGSWCIERCWTWRPFGAASFHKTRKVLDPGSTSGESGSRPTSVTARRDDDVIVALKILHYSVMVLPDWPSSPCLQSTSEGEILTLKPGRRVLKVTQGRSTGWLRPRRSPRSRSVGHGGSPRRRSRNGFSSSRRAEKADKT